MSHPSKTHLYAEDLPSYFQYQWDQYLSGARIGSNTDLFFVSKSYELVSAHQALLLPLSSHLQSLIDSCKSHGWAEDVPKLILPDWSTKAIEAFINLIYSGSVTVSSDVMEELLKLMHELRIEISLEQLLSKPILPTPSNIEDLGISSKNLREEEVVAENQMSTDSISISGIFLDYKKSCIKGIKKIETEGENKEQERVIQKLSGLLDFLKCNHVKNEESFVMVSKPLDNLLSCWKYLPTQSSFDKLPMEIKSQILSYLCNSGALIAASVCCDWKAILRKRLIEMDEVKMGKHCSNTCECEEFKCFMPEELLKASITVNLDVRLKICHPIKDIDPSLLSEALVKLSEFDILNTCGCVGHEEDHDFYNGTQMITQNQMEMLFENMEKKKLRMTSLGLSFDMNNMDQDRLLNCLFKAKRLLLGFGSIYGSHLDAIKFIEKLSQNTGKRFSQLYLERLMYPFDNDHLSDALVSGLCKIKTIYLGQSFRIPPTERLIQHIVAQPVRTKNLFIFNSDVNWSGLITTEALLVLSNIKLKRFVLYGTFNSEQVEVIRAVPGVSVHPHTGIPHLYLIRKGFDIHSFIAVLNGRLSAIF